MKSTPLYSNCQSSCSAESGGSISRACALFMAKPWPACTAVEGKSLSFCTGNTHCLTHTDAHIHTKTNMECTVSRKRHTIQLQSKRFMRTRILTHTACSLRCALIRHASAFTASSVLAVKTFIKYLADALAAYSFGVWYVLYGGFYHCHFKLSLSGKMLV